VKYPKLAAAIDEFLAKVVAEHAEDSLMGLIAMATQPVDEKLPAIPVTKELILSEQTEVRNGN